MVSSSDDERKRRRMLSNRESARRSRMKKQQHLDELVQKVAQLMGENGRIASKIDAVARRYAAVEADNTVLRTRLSELTERLRSVSSVLLVLQGLSGMTMDIPEIPDPLLKPWQPPCPTQAILASAEPFFY